MALNSLLTHLPLMWNSATRYCLIIIQLALFTIGCDVATQKVAVDGHILRVRVQGSSLPTVVFESGAGAGLDSWAKVQPTVSRFARTVSYDRAGLGKSEPGPAPRHALQIASELHTALQKLGIQPPYILVGHSTGAFYIRLFAHAYPEEVAGLVFVDPNTEQLADWFKVNVPQDLIAKAEMDSLKMPLGQRAEWQATHQTAEQIRSAHLPVNLSSVVLTAMRPEPNHLSGFLEALLMSHEALAKRFPKSKHIVTAKSGHNIQQEQPELVAQAIQDLVEQIRNSPAAQK
jgi:pimeloyl-ACP methyl ester carboxylesterase